MDIFHFSYITVNFDAEYGLNSFKVVSLSVCLLLTKTRSIHISFIIGPILPIFLHTFVKFDADYDSDGLKVVSLFVSLSLTRSGTLLGPNNSSFTTRGLISCLCYSVSYTL